MLTDKQVKKFQPIMNDFICGFNRDFRAAIVKLTKLELMLLTTHTHQIMHIGKTKHIELQDKIIFALENQHRIK